MRAHRQPAAFTLIEVMLAVGVFAIAALSLLALLPSLIAQQGEIADRSAAQNLAEHVSVELRRVAASGFDTLAQNIPELGTPLPDGFAMVATRECDRLHTTDFLPPPPPESIPADQQYFLVEGWRHPEEPLAYTPARALLAVEMRVSWPYRLPGVAGPVPMNRRRQLHFVASLVR